MHQGEVFCSYNWALKFRESQRTPKFPFFRSVSVILTFFQKWGCDKMGVFIAPCASVEEVSLVCWSKFTCNIGELVMISCVCANWNECGKSSWNITLPFSFLPWIVLLCFGKMLVKPCRTLETNGETFLMPKFFIVFPIMCLTFPTNTMITNGMNFLQYRT